MAGGSSSTGEPIAFEPGDSVAVAILRAGDVARARRDAVPGGRLRELPRRGRRRRVRPDVPGGGAARAGRSCAHPAEGLPALPVVRATAATSTPLARQVEVARREVDVAVIGGGSAGREAAATAERAGKTVLVLDAGAGDEVVAIYAGPDDRRADAGGMLHVHAHEIVVATGAAEIHPVVPGSGLRGLVTARAAERLHAPACRSGRPWRSGRRRTGWPRRRSPGGWCGSRARTVGSARS